MAFPVKLKENCLNQLNQVSYEVDSSSLLGLSLSTKISDRHIAISIVINALKQCDDVDLHIDGLDKLLEIDLSSSMKIMVVSSDGDSFLLCREQDDQYSLTEYFNVNEEIFRHQASLAELIKDFDLVDQAFYIQSAVKPKNMFGNGTMDTNTVDVNYTFKHFFAHKPTILSIIGAIVFMALLSVVTPLGFQIFSDKNFLIRRLGNIYGCDLRKLLDPVAEVFNFLVLKACHRCCR